MFVSHKEKERLRHQKQVILLNQVMKLVPKFSNEPQTKVRKLRRLILYTHYLRMVHSEIMKKCPRTDDCENSVIEKSASLISDSRKSPCNPMKNIRPKRANIVFLQADKSLNSTWKSQKNYLHDVSSQCNEESTTLSTGYEYEIPALVPVKDVMSMQFDPEATCISENAYHSQIDAECNISFKDESSKSELLNVNKNSFKTSESSLSARSPSDTDKESNQPISCSNVTERLSEEISFYKDSISLFSAKASMTKHKSNNVNSQQNNTFKESNFALNDENISNNYSHYALDMNQESLLNSPDPDHIQNYSSDYSFFTFPNKSKITHPYYYNFCHSDYPFNFVSKMLPKNDLSLSAENASSDTSSCPSNDKISIDIENISDSNPSCNSLGDSSDSAQFNFHDSYPDSGHSSFKITETQNHSDETMVYEPVGIGYTAFSAVPPDYTCLGENILRHNSSNKSMYEFPFSYVNSICPPSIPFSKSTYGMPISSDSNSKSYKRYENKNIADSDSFYLPHFSDSFHKEFSLIQPKLEVVDTAYESESFCKENVKPSLFEEEVSYPLSQYFSMDK